MGLARWRWISLLALIAVTTMAACSGGPAPSAADDVAAGEITDDLGDDGADDKIAKGKKAKKGAAGTNKRKKKKGAAPAAAASGTTVTASGQATSERQQARRSEKLERRLPDVNLWPKETNRMGITKDKIVLCGHAALTFADVFDTRPEDLKVYWEWVNDNGGIFGRKVEITWEDDGYRPDNAVQASERCKAREPFILLGGIGFDQIPAVRAWNEQSQNRLLYLHHIARADLSKRYSFSYLPTVEQVGVLAARWVLQKHANKKIGVIWRQSEAWQPGHKTFLSTLRNGGKRPVADLPVQNGQSIYTQQISELKARGAQTVFVWENALAATEIIKQAKSQDYSPTWLVFPFNLTTDALRDDALNPPVEGIATWAPYVPGYKGGPFKYYAPELRRFEEAQRRYGAARQGNDILWMVWLAFKQLHQLFLDCGPDCSRNEIVALLISGVHKPVYPNCPFDFTRNQHVGGFMGNIFRAFRPPSGPAAGWMEVARCVRI